MPQITYPPSHSLVEDVHAGKAFGFGKVEHALHFAVEPVPYLFEHDVGIGILAGMLTDSSDASKNFIEVGQVEITAKGEIFGTPVVAAQEWVYVGNAGLSGSGVSQMSHIGFTGKRQGALGELGVVELFGCEVFEIGLNVLENFGNGSGT